VISNIDVGNTGSFTIRPNNGLGVGPYTATVTVSGGNVTPKTFNVSFTVNALVHAETPTISVQPANTTYGQDATATALTVTAGVTDGGNLSYRWFKNTTNSTTGGTQVGGDSASYTPPTATVGTVYYYVVVTNTNNSVNGTKTATATSSVATVTVHALLGINIGFNFGAITIQGAEGSTTIHRTGNPTSLTLTAPEYDSIKWYVDGVLKTGATGRSITLTATAYDIRKHSVTFTGVKDGIPYSRLIPFTVEP
jgi:hypothetical protein